MARDRRSARTPSVPSVRITRRFRGVGRARAETPDATPPEEMAADGKRTVRLPKIPTVSLTRRALVVLSLVVVLALSYANTLRIFISQQNDLGVAAAQIRERSDQIAQLQDELDRWNDPAYVRAQARERLGWLLPGEVGYRVVGPDGKPLAGGVVIDSQAKLPAGEHRQMWFDRMWGSVETADAPARRVGN